MFYASKGLIIYSYVIKQFVVLFVSKIGLVAILSKPGNLTMIPRLGPPNEIAYEKYCYESTNMSEI